MLNKVPAGIVVTQLCGITAIQLTANREPLLTWSATVPKSHPKDYFVPNFGPDHDVIATAQDLKEAEKIVGKKWDWKDPAKAPKGPPQDYFVPNFGVDEDIKSTLGNEYLASQQIGHKWEIKAPGKPNAVDYKVANFGVDHDVIATAQDLKVAEAQLGHKWVVQDPSKAPKGPPQDYFVPNFGVDDDVKGTLGNEFLASKQLNHKWEIKEPSKAAKIPQDYFVPNFGVDHDVIATATDLKVAEAQLGHHWEVKAPGKPNKVDYKVANFGLDDDMKTSLKNLKDQEAIHGNWELPQDDVQLDAQISTEREPLLTWSATVPKTHPMNYKVPNFGVDHDVIATATDLKVAEAQLKHKWDWKDPAKAPKGAPKDYFVPNFGVDEDVKGTLSNEFLASQQVGHKWEIKDPSKAAKIPQDYFVPNFGVDHDVIATANDLKVAEAQLGHHWEVKEPAKPHKVDYKVANFGLDSDIKTSLSNLKSQEAIHGKWELPQDDVQLDAQISTEREPLLTWRQSKPKSHPVDYFVPNFGVDHDIVTSQSNEKAAESKLGHDWNPVIDPKTEKYAVPSHEIEFKLLQTGAEAEREPLLTWSPTAKKLPFKQDYFVPNFGLDHDILASQTDLKVAEGITGHKWDYKDPKKAPKAPPKDYFVPNFGLDHDVRVSLKNLNDQEAIHGKWNIPEMVQLSDEKSGQHKKVKDQKLIDAKLKKIAEEEKK